MNSYVISNLYFYTVLGGYLIAIALFNLLYGESVPGTIGYVFAVPTIVFWVRSALFSKRSRRLPAFFYKYIAFGAVFFVWVLFTSIVNGINDEQIFKKFFVYFMSFSIIPYLTGLVIASRIDELNVKWAYVVCLILIVLGVASGIENRDLLLNGSYRITGYANLGENDYGVILGCYSIISCFALYCSNLNPLVRIGSILFLVIVSPILAFYSGSMGGLLSLYSVLLLIFLLSALKNTNAFIMFFLKAIGVVGLSFMLFMAVVNYGKNTAIFGGGENISKYLARFEAIGNADWSNIEQARSSLMSLYWGQFLANPLIGSGFGNREGVRSDPHNFIIELLGETGLVSLLLFLVIFLPGLRKSFYILKSYGRNSVLYLIAVAFIAYSCESLFSGSIFINPLLWMLMGILPSQRV
ncbi:MAG: hypothetical protein A2270_07330 [Elusimicrobia bacterium RIFOXYA12_FULL_51_18]|nr:MAG: hypothetical protein A2270_07330 [Elusimicrobia bacterium RIFOXYA12_FULL_51_18]OGS28494.1 MAG: hypothetical protein A2218_05635 [Elusimicrobia bacterium RIFOXYA2_FULL_53_38]